jgi:hypothetical protein
MTKSRRAAAVRSSPRIPQLPLRLRLRLPRAPPAALAVLAVTQRLSRFAGVSVGVCVPLRHRVATSIASQGLWLLASRR